jgi:hypothetical protein
MIPICIQRSYAAQPPGSDLDFLIGDRVRPTQEIENRDLTPPAGRQPLHPPPGSDLDFSISGSFLPEKSKIEI